MKRWLTPNLLILTLISFTQDIASELLYPLLPYIVTAGVVSAAPITLGIIEGFAEAAAGFAKLYSGTKSDTLGRKPFVIAGYTVSALGKTLVVFGAVWSTIFFGRVTDRIGKGLRSAPRDALIHDSVENKDVGKAFGFHRTGDNIGAVVGPLIALAGLSLLNNDVRVVAKWALIPAIISGFLTLFVRETIVQRKSINKKKEKISLPKPLRKAIAILVFIQLTNIPNALLLLRLYDLHFSIQGVVLTYTLYNLVTVIFSYPGGYLADKFDPLIIYAFGLLIFAISYATLGFTTSKPIAIFALIIYGLFPAFTDGVGKAWIAKLSENKHHGRAQGVYQASMNFAVLGAGIWAGAFWSKGSTQPVLIIAGAGAAIGGIFFVTQFFIKKITKHD